MARKKGKDNGKKPSAKDDGKKPSGKGDGAKPGRKRTMGAFWAGTITFGLIAVPVQLFPANRRNRVSLRMLDEDGTPLRRRYFCPNHERLVESDEIVRGYEVDEGEHVLVSDEELEAVSPGKSREIDLQRFVDASHIPSLFFERAYFLTPVGDSNKAYRLLADVMERTGRAGIATFVMRNKEYLVAILAEDGILRAETLRFQDEVRGPESAGLHEDPEVDEGEVARFEEAIRSHTADGLDPDEMKDEFAAALGKLVSTKRKKGRDVVVVDVPSTPADEGDAPAEGDDEEALEEVDLLETIRISLRSGNGSRETVPG
ncbi:MAG: Ku protein [Gemmatimonadota bacterium]